MDRAALDARLRAKALACVALREHSRVELRRKLLVYLDRQERSAAAHVRPGTMPGDAEVEADIEAQAASAQPPGASCVDAVLDWLAERDLLSAERFVETRVQARASRFGHLRIRQELMRHGVELDATTDQRLRDTELARAHVVWSRRFELPSDAKDRSRQMRFLLARGFSADIAIQVLRGVGAPPVDDD